MSVKTPSRPARGAWIEIITELNGVMVERGHAPQGARGLKFLFDIIIS